MTESLEEPPKHLAALYNTSFVILSGKAFFSSSSSFMGTETFTSSKLR